MDFLTSGFNVLLIILGFGVLIFIHELGHFIAAKWADIRTEAFAVGMGPVLLGWRKGIGLRVGSTAREYEKRVRNEITRHKTQNTNELPADSAPSTQHSALSQAEMYRIGDKLGLGETEYSLRILPIGGFVKMLGQEDANPNYVSNDPRSYTMCPVGKRMIVVSAGVIMNLLLAIVLFIIAFMIGVRFEAPVVGDVSMSLPAGSAVAANAKELGITGVGLQPGDEVTHINGEPARTFADLQIASAMSKPGDILNLSVNRAGVPEPLEFNLRPEKDPMSGLLGIGVLPGKSTQLWERDEDDFVRRTLGRTGLAEAGVGLGMRMIRAEGKDVQTYEQFNQRVHESNGQPVQTDWAAGQEGVQGRSTVHAAVPVQPSFALQLYPKSSANQIENFDFGLIGLTPLVELEEIPEGENAAVLKKGDVVLRFETHDAPSVASFRQIVSGYAKRTVQILVLREGREVTVTAKVDGKGKLNVHPDNAWKLPLIAAPIERVRTSLVADAVERPTPVASLNLAAGSRIEAVGPVRVHNWAEIRKEFQAQTQQANLQRTGATISLTVFAPSDTAQDASSDRARTVQLQLSPEDVASLHKLTWQTDLSSIVFRPLQTTLTADGNPIKAISMGFAETKKLVLMTYLTIDRLIRRSVGVDQLRGPVGIVHLGSKIVDRGLTYLIFFLAMISVNLAVINFLPMPIVDGGLFLFLIYEKLKGRPPPLAFQNAATVVGLCLIVTMFLVVTWNDVMRLLG